MAYPVPMATMRAAALGSPGSLALTTRPVPEPGPGEVLLAVEATTICGTHLRIESGAKTRGVTPGVVLGHEVAGRVAALGGGLGAGAPAVGAQVGLAPEWVCGSCGPCACGRANVCENMRLFGTTVDGGLADYLLVPAPAVAQCVVAVERETDPALLALAEPLSCCLRAHARLGIGAGDTVAVLGTGPIGLIHCALAARAGARVIASGRPARLEPALRFGAAHATAATGAELVAEARRLTGGRGADAVIVAVGAPELAGVSLELAAVGARVSYFAGFSAGASATIDPNLVHYRELAVLGSANATHADYAEAVRLLSSGALDLGGLITHRFALGDVHAAFDAVRRRRGLKAAVLPGMG